MVRRGEWRAVVLELFSYSNSTQGIGKGQKGIIQTYRNKTEEAKTCVKHIFTERP